MKRREFITLLGGAAVAWPTAARAQQSAMPVVGILGATTAQGYAAQMAAFWQGLNETGFIEGRNVAIEYRWAEDQYDRLPALAADLVRRQVAVIATIVGNASSSAAKAATTTIPVVFHGSLDPVEAGFVASLNRPGGNLTGVVTLNVDTGQKRLELIHELVPTATTIGLLLNPTNAVAETQSKDLQAAARTLGLQLRRLSDGSVDIVSVVDLELDPIRITDRVVVGDGPEGLAISPKGDVAVAVILAGSNNRAPISTSATATPRFCGSTARRSPRSARSNWGDCRKGRRSPPTENI